MAGAFRRWNARRRSPSMRALREAGPPLRWIVAAVPLALAVVIVLYVAGVHNRAVLVAIPFVAFVLVCFIDRDGWRIRMAMAEVAGRQRERWRWGRIPIDAMSADAWLAAHADAPPAARASMLGTLGRHEEALELVRSASAETPQDALNLARMRILFDGRGARRSLDRGCVGSPRRCARGGGGSARRAPLPAAVAGLVDRLAPNPCRGAVAHRFRERRSRPAVPSRSAVATRSSTQSSSSHSRSRTSARC